MNTRQADRAISPFDEFLAPTRLAAKAGILAILTGLRHLRRKPAPGWIEQQVRATDAARPERSSGDGLLTPFILVCKALWLLGMRGVRRLRTR